MRRLTVTDGTRTGGDPQPNATHRPKHQMSERKREMPRRAPGTAVRSRLLTNCGFVVAVNPGAQTSAKLVGTVVGIALIGAVIAWISSH
jgi:hypothetical protein